MNENRYWPEATLKYTPWRVTLSSRNRLEYRNRNTTDSWRYRNQFKAAYPLPFIKKISIVPFVADEIFWDVTGHSFNQNRIISGITFGFNQHASFSIYYLLKSNRTGSDWNETNVVGTSLNLSI